MKKKSTQKIGIYIVIVCGILWALSGVLGQLLFQNTTIKVSWLSAIRMIFSGIVILTFLLFKDRKQLFALWKNSKFIIQIFYLQY